MLTMNLISMNHILTLVMCLGPVCPTEVQVRVLSCAVINKDCVRFMSTVPLFCPSSGSRPILNLTIQTRGNVSSVNSQPVLCEVIGSLISIFREFRALCLLRNRPMLRPLLAPHVSYFTHTLDSPPDLDSPVSLGYLKQWFLILILGTYSIAHLVCLLFFNTPESNINSLAGSSRIRNWACQIRGTTKSAVHSYKHFCPNSPTL